MKYITYRNPLYYWWRQALIRTKKTGVFVYPEWTTWRGFAEWAEANGYDENSKLRYNSCNPFTPEYLGVTRAEDRDCEYIAYEASDPYELIIASASYVDDLSATLKRMGYNYTPESIISALSRNEERTVENRLFGLIFEKVDLSNYEDDGTPFERKVTL